MNKFTYDEIKGTLEALPNFNNTIHTTYTYTDDDGTHNIELMDADFFKFYQSYHYGDRFFFGYGDDADRDSIIFLNIWSRFIQSRAKNYGRMAVALLAEYNPIENYDKNSTITVSYEGKETNATSYSGSVVDELEKLGKESTSTTIGSHTDTTTNKVSPEDDETYFENEQTINDNASRTDSNDLTFENRKDKNTTSYNNRKDTTDRTFDDRIDTTTEHTHGNVGTTQNQQMVENEIQLRRNNAIMEIIIDDFNAEYSFYI